MSKFIKTVHLWEAGVQESICNGTLKIQRGQYVLCGTHSDIGLYPLSRYVSHNKESGTINVVHGGTGKEVLQRFKARTKDAKFAELYKRDKAAYFKAKKALRGSL